MFWFVFSWWLRTLNIFLSPLPMFLWGCSPTDLLTLTSPPWHSPTLAHCAFTGPKASPSNDSKQGSSLLCMQLDPWVAPCVIFGWWFSPWELWGDLVGWYCCSSYGVANHFSSFSPFSNSSIVNSMLSPMVGCEHPPLSQSLAKPLRRQIYQALVSNHFLESEIMSGFGVSIRMDPQVGLSLDEHFFKCFSVMLNSSVENFQFSSGHHF